jgi:very-short-patch-repair endonuclease/energy-coupling factor transporter ATP-binding protein EcfA2
MDVSGARMPSAISDGKSRVERLFQFIRAYTKLQHPAARHVSEQPLSDMQMPFDALPTSSEWLTHWVETEAPREWLLKVKLCPPTPCPTPPPALAGWLLPGWDKFTQPAHKVAEKTTVDAQGQTQIETFEADAERPTSYAQWSPRRAAWASEQARHEPVRQLFSRLQTLRAELQKRSEQVELVLGTALFKHTAHHKAYQHPLFMKPIGMEFDALENTFTLTETDRPTELYAELLFDFDIDRSPVGLWLEQIKNLHPLDAQAGIHIQSIHDWLVNQPELAQASVSASPVIFLRDRGGWPSRAANDVLDDLAQRSEGELPPYLLRLVGAAHAVPADDANPPAADFVANEAPDILFALPANIEQLQLARQIENKDVVLVQGPPGTGKTHTIANLLGHLLSQGKRVLVTSHTSKALKVLRDKVPENIQSLCVSVLDDAAKSRKELEHAVRSIAERMQQGNSLLSRQAEDIKKERALLLARIQTLREQQRACVRKEYEPLVLGGTSTTPVNAAKEVRNGLGVHDWIPGPLEDAELGQVCPLSVAELMWLYASSTQISAADEKSLSLGVPPCTDLVTPQQFAELVAELDTQRNIRNERSGPLWSSQPPNKASLARLQESMALAIDALHAFDARGPWFAALMEAGFDEPLPTVWQELLELTATVNTLARSTEAARIEHGPQVPKHHLNEDTLKLLHDIKNHVASGKGFKFYHLPLAQQFSGSWKKLIEEIRCNDAPPTRREHFEALIYGVELALARARLVRRWERQVVAMGGVEIAGPTPERIAAQWVPHIQAALAWFHTHWRAVQEHATRLGRPWQVLENLTPPDASHTPQLARARLLCEQHLIPECQFHWADIRIQEIQATLDALSAQLLPSATSEFLTIFAQACAQADTALYQQCYEELARLNALKPDAEQRAALLARLEQGAARWAMALRLRADGFDQALNQNTEVAAAWQWRQYQDMLERRAQLDAAHIAEALRQQSNQLQHVTSELIAAQCWARQLSVAEKFRMHLVGWLDSMTKIGKGTGKSADRYRAEARMQLKNGQHAVPVWIMPLAEVFRSLDVKNSRFDVVIVDEASQAGMGGLLAAYMGKKVVVVGDHEQVSPDAVGQDLAAAEALQLQYLTGFPNISHYDGQLSLYAMSRWTASGMLSLSEHFRCMPSIIGFSNRLSYQGRIKPLRDPKSSSLLPVVPFKVSGSRVSRQKINREEAWQIVALIKAMCTLDAYANRSIGVVSLLGEDQAKLVDGLIRQHIPISEIENRRMVCGNAAQFQGDEREIIFLSMVDSNEGDGPMRKLGEGANDLNKKRYNVAASRAQNQMWVIHSVDHATDLKPDDIRRELLDYCYVEAQKQTEITQPHRTDSEFERLVLKELLQRGYQVQTQYKVGFYRIDMVIAFNGQQLAVECDGEKWHSGAEKIAEDFARQAVLERLGWTFHRIRGSQFFRDPTGTIEQLVERLDQLGIQPIQPNQANTPTHENHAVHHELLRLAQVFKAEIAASATSVRSDAAPVNRVVYPNA